MTRTGLTAVLGTRSAEEWTGVLGRTRQYDFHHLPQYHRVAEQRGEGVAHLFVYSDAQYTIALPLLLRDVDPAEPSRGLDATSVYGYGGPVSSHHDLPVEVVRRFQVGLTEELIGRRVIAAFSRLHPLIPQTGILAGLGDCPVAGETISIDLTASDEEQRAGYNKSCRRSLRRLQQAGFIGLHDQDYRYLAEFVEVYQETMRRAGARRDYHYDDSYFDLLTQELRGTSQLFVALKDGVVAAATLCTLCDGILQDHLGGTRDAYLSASPDRLVVDTERRWANEMGARTLHLGGGVGAQDDSLFRYKSGFSDRRHTFRTWRWVLMPEEYDALCEDAAPRDTQGRSRVDDGHFPAYRCPTTSTVRTAETGPGVADVRRREAQAVRLRPGGPR